MAQRFQNWPSLFDAALEGKSDTPWEWGAHDCALFAADMVKAICGCDLGKGLRGYKSVRGALGTIRRAGGFAEMIDASARRYGVSRIALEYAGRGDPVLARHPTDEIFGLEAGVIDTSGRFVIVAQKVGWVMSPISAIEYAWKIE